MVVKKDGDGYYVRCPAFKGVHTCGSTIEEAINNAKDAVNAYVVSLIKHNR